MTDSDAIVSEPKLAEKVSLKEGSAENDLGFDPTKKKRKKKTGVTAATNALASLSINSSEDSKKDNAEDASSAQLSEESKVHSSNWTDSDREYEYKELLVRICELIVADKGLDAFKGRKKSIEPPEVGKVGTKRIAWVNFVSNCKSINRKPEHVLEFVLTELGATGSIAGDNKLIIKGRFQGKQLETVLRRYIADYVACRTCRSGNTDLKKENRILYKVCKDCGASPSICLACVGFRVQTRRRKA
ncbi:eukaryotic translation initiation factor 2 subunit 2-like [Schistocerca gregaria]|uniref:eukaryotic translation initiation factor 2 subunit 2-like n=1 Tax=Schistocerca gregaria TaxID=7010 RepID=UPI00211EF67A|nr:eukaryotic translation initiation factor 2 subunit 2-like [Schistocerca gregaria]